MSAPTLDPRPTVRLRRPALDHSQLIGSWRNADSGTGAGILALNISEVDGELGMRVLGRGPSGPVDWGRVGAVGRATTPTSTTAWACTAGYDLGAVRTSLSASTRGGVLVVTTCNVFAAPGAGEPYWTRGFFHRDTPGWQPADPARRPGDRAPRLPGSAPRLSGLRPPVAGPPPAAQLPVSGLVGIWRSFDLSSARAARIQITEEDGRLLIRPFGGWTPRRHDWHVALGQAYLAGSGGSQIAFSARYNLYVCQVDMVGHLDRGLLTVECATTFWTGSGRSPYFVRERLHRTPHTAGQPAPAARAVPGPGRRPEAHRRIEDEL